MSRSKPTVAFERITPAKATKMLEGNIQNRNVRSARVAGYARDMFAGKWMLGGELILVHPDGSLGNGQHRLLAVVESGKTVTLPVARNVPSTAQDVADQGMPRRFSDVLRLRFNETSVVTLAAAVKQLHVYRATGQMTHGGGGTASTNPTITELIQTYQANPGLSTTETISFRNRARKNGLKISDGMLVAIVYIFREVDPEEADPFFERLIEGTGLEPGNPILALRRVLMGPSRPSSPKAQAALIIKAFNYWREGRQIFTLSWKGGGDRPEAFPMIYGNGAVRGGRDDD